MDGSYPTKAGRLLAGERLLEGSSMGTRVDESDSMRVDSTGCVESDCRNISQQGGATSRRRGRSQREVRGKRG